MTTDRTRPTDFDHLASAWLADGPTELVDRVLDAALWEVHSTHQRRALRVPWRFPYMPALTRTTSFAAVAVVVVLGVGGLVLVNSRGPGGPISSPSPAPATDAPTTVPTATPAPTPLATDVAMGIHAWTPYSSEQYPTVNMSFPAGWRLDIKASRDWQSGDPVQAYADIFVTDAAPGGLGVFMYQVPAGDADVSTHDGLLAWVEAYCVEDSMDWCGDIPANAVPMCSNREACGPAFLVPTSNEQFAFISDPITLLFKDTPDAVTVVFVGRPDDVPATAQYGGSVALLKSILTTMDVWTPSPGQTPKP